MQLRYPLASSEVVWEWAVSHVMKHWETKVERVVLGKEWRSEVSMGFQDCTGSWKAGTGLEVGGSAKRPGATEGLGHSVSMGCGIDVVW